MCQITELGSAQITAVESITVELVAANESPAVVIVRWPVEPSVIHPHRFAGVAAVVVRMFAEAHRASQHQGQETAVS